MYTATSKNMAFQIKHYVFCKFVSTLWLFFEAFVRSFNHVGSYNQMRVKINIVRRNLQAAYEMFLGRCCPKNNNSGSVPIILLIRHCLPMRKRPKRWL